MKEQKRSSKAIDIVSSALKVSVNGVMCVCGPFQVKKVYVSTKTWVTGNNLILHKSLITGFIWPGDTCKCKMQRLLLHHTLEPLAFSSGPFCRPIVCWG